MSVAEVRDWVIVIILPLWFALKVIWAWRSMVERPDELEREQSTMAARNGQVTRQVVSELLHDSRT